MDIIFTAVGVILVLAVWPALVLYASNDSLLRNPRRLSWPAPSRRSQTRRVSECPGLRASTPGTP